VLARQGLGCEAAAAAATQRPPASPFASARVASGASAAPGAALGAAPSRSPSSATSVGGAALPRTPDGCPSALLLRSPGAACRALLGLGARSTYNVSGDVCDPTTARREVCRLDEFERACRMPRGGRLTGALARRHAFGVHELGCCRGGAHARSRRRVG
jgi:hypothetical protein